MRFSIGTVTNFGEYSDLEKLLKCSILYADDVELLGMTEYAVFSYFPRILSGKGTIEDTLRDLLPVVKTLNIPNKEQIILQLEAGETQLRSLAPILQKKRYRNKAEIQAQIKLNLLRREIQTKLQEGLECLFDQPLSQEINRLVQSGTVSVFDYHIDGFNTDEYSGGYFASLLQAVHSQNAFPLFDETSCQLVGTAVKSHVVDISKLNPEVYRHAGVASNLLMTLPTLHSASFDELQALKRENSDALVRYRKAVYGFSEKISSLPWDDDFQFECIKLYETEVLPNITEINELMTDTSVLKNLGKKILADEEMRKKMGWIAGGLTTAITASTPFLAGIRTLIQAMSLATLSKGAVEGFLRATHLYVEAHDEAKESKEKAQNNVMYYYYLAANRK